MLVRLWEQKVLNPPAANSVAVPLGIPAGFEASSLSPDLNVSLMRKGKIGLLLQSTFPDAATPGTSLQPEEWGSVRRTTSCWSPHLKEQLLGSPSRETGPLGPLNCSWFWSFHETLTVFSLCWGGMFPCRMKAQMMKGMCTPKQTWRISALDRRTKLAYRIYLLFTNV